MKVKEVLLEGIFQDLATLGRAEQDRMRQSRSAMMGRAGAAVKGALGKLPGASFLQQQAAAIKQAAQDAGIQQMADRLAAAWEIEAKKINASMPQGQVMSVDEYKQRAAAWLEQAMQGQVRVDEKNMDPYITQTDAKQMREYLAKHFLPAYKVSTQSAAPQIPNGYQVLVKGGSAGKTKIPNEIYSWRNGRWTDQSGQPVIAGSTLHNSLTQDAVNNIQSKQTSQTI
jgi:hypothetical protein